MSRRWGIACWMIVSSWGAAGLHAQVGDNIALLGIASQSSTCFNSPGNLAIDGNLGNFTHTCAGGPNPAIWEVDLGFEAEIGAVIIHNRDSCCFSRLRDIVVSVHDIPFTADVPLDPLLQEASEFTFPLWEDALWESDLLNPENVLSGPETLILNLEGLDVFGQFLRITRLPDVDRSGTDGLGGAADDPVVLSLGEVEIYEGGFGCPEEGDTHCEGLTVEGPEGDRPGLWTVTATGSDDSGDPITYTFTAEHEGGTMVSVQDATGAGVATLGLIEPGTWTITARADDDTICNDEAEDAVCTETVQVTELAGKVDFLGRIKSSNFLVLGPFQLPGPFACGAADLSLSYVAPTFLGCEYPVDGDPADYDPFDPEQASFAYLGETDGDGAPVWMPLDDGADDGNIDFDILPPGAQDDAVAFAVTYLSNTADAPIFAELCIQSDDGVQVWLDDRPVLSNNACRAVTGILDGSCQDTVAVTLDPGPHRLLMGVWDRTGGWAGRLGILLGGVPVFDDGTSDITFHGIERPADLGSFPCRDIEPSVILGACTIVDEGVEVTFDNPATTPVVVRVNGRVVETLGSTATSTTIPTEEFSPGANQICLDNAGLTPVCCIVEGTEGGGLCEQVARSGIASQTSLLGGYTPDLALDGNLDNFTHTLASQLGPATWEVDLGEDFVIQKITLHNRTSCCGSRLRDIIVSVHDISLVEDVPLDANIFDIADAAFPLWEEALWESDLLNEENEQGVFPLGPATLDLDLSGLDVEGRYVRVTRIPDGDLSGTGGQGNADEGAVLSLGEVDVCVGPGGEVVDPTAKFVRGDPNADGQQNITDGIYILNYLFLGGETPSCIDSADADNDGVVNITDGIYILNFLFLGGAEPAAPYPDCGVDPEGDADSISCETSHSGC